ncbi:hypothetical protein LARI1_G005457, partial [Lachnellula arida]
MTCIRKSSKLSQQSGRAGPDTTELGFWTALLCQLYLSASSLGQLIVRQHSGRGRKLVHPEYQDPRFCDRIVFGLFLGVVFLARGS